MGKDLLKLRGKRAEESAFTMSGIVAEGCVAKAKAEEKHESKDSPPHEPEFESVVGWRTNFFGLIL